MDMRASGASKRCPTRRFRFLEKPDEIAAFATTVSGAQGKGDDIIRAVLQPFYGPSPTEAIPDTPPQSDGEEEDVHHAPHAGFLASSVASAPRYVSPAVASRLTTVPVVVGAVPVAQPDFDLAPPRTYSVQVQSVLPHLGLVLHRFSVTLGVFAVSGEPTPYLRDVLEQKGYRLNGQTSTGDWCLNTEAADRLWRSEAAAPERAELDRQRAARVRDVIGATADEPDAKRRRVESEAGDAPTPAGHLVASARGVGRRDRHGASCGRRAGPLHRDRAGE